LLANEEVAHAACRGIFVYLSSLAAFFLKLTSWLLLLMMMMMTMVMRYATGHGSTTQGMHKASCFQKAQKFVSIRRSICKLQN